jgi:hypothetical protein
MQIDVCPPLALRSGPASEAYFACLTISMMQRDLPALALASASSRLLNQPVPVPHWD